MGDTTTPGARASAILPSVVGSLSRSYRAVLDETAPMKSAPKKRVWQAVTGVGVEVETMCRASVCEVPQATASPNALRMPRRRDPCLRFGPGPNLGERIPAHPEQPDPSSLETTRRPP